MPLYIVAHHTALTDSQKDALAEAITKVHTELFNTPSIFVNVRFQDITQTPCYVGGKRVRPLLQSCALRAAPLRPEPSVPL
jgi:phenylpyruvate tautomerase PptA (4-oxalocrotonate tautomerase family)